MLTVSLDPTQTNSYVLSSSRGAPEPALIVDGSLGDLVPGYSYSSVVLDRPQVPEFMALTYPEGTGKEGFRAEVVTAFVHELLGPRPESIFPGRDATSTHSSSTHMIAGSFL